MRWPWSKTSRKQKGTPRDVKKLYEQARDAQRGGDVRKAALLTAEAEALAAASPGNAPGA